LVSRYGYFLRDPHWKEPSRIQRKNKRREKSRAGMVATYSGSGLRVKAKQVEKRPKMKDLADLRRPAPVSGLRPHETNGFPRRCPAG
jgi:hypothetical protein